MFIPCCKWNRLTLCGFAHSLQCLIIVWTSVLRTSTSTNLASYFGLRRSLCTASNRSASCSSYMRRRFFSCWIRKSILRVFPLANAFLAFWTTWKANERTFKNVEKKLLILLYKRGWLLPPFRGQFSKIQIIKKNWRSWFCVTEPPRTRFLSAKQTLVTAYKLKANTYCLIEFCFFRHFETKWRHTIRLQEIDFHTKVSNATIDPKTACRVAPGINGSQNLTNWTTLLAERTSPDGGARCKQLVSNRLHILVISRPQGRCLQAALSSR